jgi:hypothetical protein
LYVHGDDRGACERKGGANASTQASASAGHDRNASLQA